MEREKMEELDQIVIYESDDYDKFLRHFKICQGIVRNAVNYEFDQKYTLLHCSNSEKINKYLISVGANIGALNIEGDTPLHAAVKYGKSVEIVKSLLSHPRVNVNVQNRDGKTPLHYACRVYNSENVSALLSHKARVDMTDNEGNTPLHTVLRYPHSLRNLQLLIGHGADVNAVNHKMDTPLHYGLYHEADKSLLDELLKHGADLDKENNLGRSPKYYAELCNIQLIVPEGKRRAGFGSTSSK